MSSGIQSSVLKASRRISLLPYSELTGNMPTNTGRTGRRSLVDRLPEIGNLEILSSAGSARRKRSVALQQKTGSGSQVQRTRRHTVQNNIPPKIHFERRRRAMTDQPPRPPIMSKESLAASFRRILRLVRSLCRVSLAIRRYAVSTNDTRIQTGFQDFLKPPPADNLPGIKEASSRGNLYFNKYVYSIANNHTFPAWARKLCSKSPEIRSYAELEKMRAYLRGHPSFSQFDYQAQMEISRNALYNRYDRKRIILNQGDNAEYYYIMISGSIYVNISHMDTNTGVEITKTVDQMKGACSFGGTALMYHTKRTASVVCDSYVEVLLVDTATFLRYCSNFLIKQHEKQKIFLDTHEVFKTWSEYRLKLLSYDVKCHFYRAKKVIDHNLTNSKYVYFIMDGSVDVFYNDSNTNNQWLHSDKLNRQVGILAGNRIFAPSSCNVKAMLRFNDKDVSRCIKVLLISNGATILYIPQTRFQEVAPKTFISNFEMKNEFEYLSPRDYEREKRKAVLWMEYRDKTTKRITKCSEE